MNSLQTAEVAVVIPTYNRAELLAEALDSVLCQSLLPTELAIVDDGSTDRTAEVVAGAERAAAGRVRVTYIRGDHTNERGKARNCGVAATSAPVLAFLDSDDVWLPRRIEGQLQAWAATPGAGFAFCNVQSFDENGPRGNSPHLSGDYNGYILGEVLEGPRAISSTLMVRREAFERVGGFSNVHTDEDYELTLRLALHYSASYSPELLVMLRQHPGRVSLRQREMPMRYYLRIVKAFLAQHPNLSRSVKARARLGLANVNLKLGHLYLQQGDRAKARRHLAAFMALRPFDQRTPAAMFQYGHTLVVRGRQATD